MRAPVLIIGPFVRVVLHPRPNFGSTSGLVQIGSYDGARSRDHHESKALLRWIPKLFGSCPEVQRPLRPLRAAAVETKTLRLWSAKYSERSKVNSTHKRASKH